MAITWPENTREIINQIRNAIGREVSFVSYDETECPTCGINPYNNEALNAFCPTCSGEGYIKTENTVLITGHVTWNPSETMQWVAGGQYYNYSCRVQIEHTEANITVVDNTHHLLVDGKPMRIENKTFRGVQDLNRILLDLQEV